MGDRDDDNPSTMLLEPPTERKPVAFSAALQSAVKTVPMHAVPRPGGTLPLPPLPAPPPPTSLPTAGRAGTLIIDSASVIAAAAAVDRAVAAAEMASQAPTAPPPPAYPRYAIQPAMSIGNAAPNVRPPQFSTFDTSIVSPKKSSAGVWVVLLVLGVLAATGGAMALGVIPLPWKHASKPSGEPGNDLAPETATATATSATASANVAPPPSAALLPATSSASAPSTSAASPARAAPEPPTVPSAAADATLLSFQAYLTVSSTVDAEVVVQGVGVGRTNEKLLVRCGQKNVRLRETAGVWLTAGTALRITCMQHITATIKPD